MTSTAAFPENPPVACADINGQPCQEAAVEQPPGMGVFTSFFTRLLHIIIVLMGMMAGLSATQTEARSIVAVSAFTADGDLAKLKGALNDALDAGLTVNEIKEVLVQLYAYMGFPRSLNGINTFMVVLDERRAQGIADEQGREASPPPADWNRDEYGAKVRARLSGSDVIPAPGGYQLFAPVIDSFLKEHLFADIFVRDILDFQSRELATISALAAVPGLEGQLQFHMGAAMNTGLNEPQMRAFVAELAGQVGRERADAADAVLTRVLAGRTK